MTAAPLPLRPELRRRPWGGRYLQPLWPAAAVDRVAGDGPFGEAWLAGPGARLAATSRAGATLDELAAELGPELVGSVPYGRYGGRFPLLVKLLDAAQPLSLQVHPDDAYALRHEGSLGKTEAWWVLAAEPGATVWWGFARPTSRDEVARAAAAGALAGLLRVLPVAPGDVVVNPAGTVHALGAGLTVYEVQQASDLTYRLDDHGRLGRDGRPRELHLQRGLEVADLRPGAEVAPAPRTTSPGRTELAHTHAFVLECVEPVPRGAGLPGAGEGRAATWQVGTGSCELLTRLPGRGGGPDRLLWDGGEAPLAPHATWLLPPGLGVVRLEGGGRYARAFVPEDAPPA